MYHGKSKAFSTFHICPCFISNLESLGRACWGPAVFPPFPSILLQPLGAASHWLLHRNWYPQKQQWNLILNSVCPHLAGPLGSRDEAKQTHLWKLFLLLTSDEESVLPFSLFVSHLHGHLSSPHAILSHLMVTLPCWWWLSRPYHAGDDFQAVWWLWQTDCYPFYTSRPAIPQTPDCPSISLLSTSICKHLTSKTRMLKVSSTPKPVCYDLLHFSECCPPRVPETQRKLLNAILNFSVFSQHTSKPWIHTVGPSFRTCPPVVTLPLCFKPFPTRLSQWCPLLVSM